MDEIDTATVDAPIALGATDIDRLPWEPLAAVGTGVEHRVLWRSGSSLAGIIRIAPGGEVSAHAHRRAHHHLWVLDGEGRALDRPLGPGSYVHIPAGVQHAIQTTGRDGLTFLYLYLQPD